MDLLQHLIDVDDIRVRFLVFVFFKVNSNRSRYLSLENANKKFFIEFFVPPPLLNGSGQRGIRTHAIRSTRMFVKIVIR